MIMSTTSDVIVIGGGIIGMSIAIDLKLQGISVTVCNKNFPQSASPAAAGMLAPYAEKLLPGPLLDLCLKSRWLYPNWIQKIQNFTNLDLRYEHCGSLAPVYDISQNRVSQNSVGQWLDEKSIHLYQPGLGSDVKGGWLYPDDGQVDNRQLLHGIYQVARTLGVDIKNEVAVHSLLSKRNKIIGISTNKGKFEASTYIVAGGAWINKFLIVPVRPLKGQMLAVKMPKQYLLQKILYGTQVYLVPRKNRNLIIGATSEDIGWTSGNSSKGIEKLIKESIKLFPDIVNWPIQEFWWGYRPVTPDKLPILGYYNYDNLIVATGHYRNGILLAPITASLISELVINKRNDPLLRNFSGDRFKNESFSLQHL
ncbi:MAG: glycine oxidase [Candidatus Atelocyanobacterium thalassa isolate SIO64986]|uniref:glycine oxidase n=1 Tax=Candidatus Atelocyanobacterium thalassa isolate SIO64986 TaxID=1527444 RepID=A0A086CFV3_9CHRO|nr:MAG: glycine oxidase [Candidatus Atelocyanobacterium thalassa isolate SIO64986]